MPQQLNVLDIVCYIQEAYRFYCEASSLFSSFIRIDLKVCYSLIHSYTIHADKLQLSLLSVAWMYR